MRPHLVEDCWMQIDALRQRVGDVLDQLGWGRKTTPARRVHRWRTVELLAFHDAGATGPPLLIVPAPIKSWYIWDLAPDVSIVRRCVSEGMRVYLMAWHGPDAGDEDLGLAEYADQLIINCLNTIASETEQARAFIAGHSLGGTLAAVFASLHANRVQGLVEIEGPMEFDSETGRLEAALRTSPAGAAVGDMLGNVPGSFLDLASIWADPLTFVSEPLQDWFASLASPRAAELHARVRRWTLHETPMPRRLFEEVASQLYRENRFANGTLDVARRRADPAAITAPIIAVFDPSSRVIPPTSVAAYRERTLSQDVQLLEYGGDVGVVLQHAGVLVGENARPLWRRILDWIHEHHAAGR